MDKDLRKEVYTHLRGVHFTLLITVVAVTIVSIEIVRPETARALNQLETLSKFHRWSLDNANKYYSTNETKIYIENTDVKMGFNFPSDYLVESKTHTRRYFADASQEGSISNIRNVWNSIYKVQSRKLSIDQAYLITEKKNGKVTKDIAGSSYVEQIDLANPPVVITDPVEFIIVESQSPSTTIWDEFEVVSKKSPEHDFYDVEGCGGYSKLFRDEPTQFNFQIKRSLSNKDAVGIICSWLSETQIVLFRLVYEEDIRLPGLQDFVREINLNRELNEFDDMYSDLLYTIGSNNYYRSIPDAKKLIQTDLLQQVQLFGIYIPISLIFLGGSSLIVIIQFYFYLHFRNMISMRCFGDGFPWIGLYSDYLSRFMFLVTATLFPLAALSLLIYVSSSIRVIDGAMLLLSFVFSFASFIMVLSFWKMQKESVERGEETEIIERKSAG